MSTIYFKSKGKQQLQECLSRNYDFVFTNLLKKRGSIVIEEKVSQLEIVNHYFHDKVTFVFLLMSKMLGVIDHRSASFFNKFVNTKS